jgi:long-subunit acyl-CoA synthetase (AMP-forming)
MAINKTFTPASSEAEDLDMDGRTCTLMGDTAFCDVQISEWNELIVKGDICVYDDWFATGDIVKFEKGSYWYYGRK